MIMDEDEMLYREMNEEDPWYMGDEPEYEDDEYEDNEYEDVAYENGNYDEPIRNSSHQDSFQQRGGCATLFSFLLLGFGLITICTFISLF